MHHAFPGCWRGSILMLALGVGGIALARAQSAGAEAVPQRITIQTGQSGDSVTLSGPDAWRQLLVTGHIAGGKTLDLTRSVTYAANPADVVRIEDTGFVTPLKDGQASIHAKTASGLSASIKVHVSHMAAPRPVSFTNEIVPIFTRLGCNSGGCHGKTGGQNGFALSLFGFEPAEDYEYIVKEARGRRINLNAPEHSLLLRKATGTIAHAGGKRLPLDSVYYRLLRRWIAEGTPRDKNTDPVVIHIEVQPRNRVLPPGSSQQLVVLAHLSDGSLKDVTRLAQFDSNDKEMAEVASTGLVSVRRGTGSVAVMARFQGHVDVFNALVPLGALVATLPASKNFIDDLVFKRLKSLGLPPSDLCDDATFLRRATIDISGRLPTMEEATAFLDSKDANKYEHLVDRLLAGDDYAYYFAGKWSAVLRNRRKSDKDDPKITAAFHAWIMDSLKKNKPFDQLVRGVLTVSGPHTENPPVIWFREVSKINDQVEDVAQLFLGQRITCARCHHHPFEKWSQQDYWGMAAFFSRVEFKDPPPPKKEKGMKDAPPKPPMTVAHKPGLAEAQNPRTGLMVKPTGLGAGALQLTPETDPRGKLVDWMASPDNPYFARALVNRYWKHFFGRGLVEPEDDMRGTNPPTNPELLDALARFFIESKYDLKKLVRLLATSQVYRLSAEPHAHNVNDRQNFSRFQARRLSAEVLLDAIDDVTLVRSTFKGVAAGTRAVQLPDNQADSYFLSVFGRPDFASACECERSGDGSLAQALHLANSNDVMAKIAKGRATKLVKDSRPHAEKIKDIYLAAFARLPDADETRVLLAFIERHPGNPQRAYEDILWSIVNTKEFLFNH